MTDPQLCLQPSFFFLCEDKLVRKMRRNKPTVSFASFSDKSQTNLSYIQILHSTVSYNTAHVPLVGAFSKY